MSQQPSSSKSSASRKRQSTGSMARSYGSDPPPQPHPWPLAPMHMYNPYLMAGALAQGGSRKKDKAAKKEWDSSSSSSNSDAEDFVPVKKRKSTTSTAKPSKPPAAASAGEKRGPGRPSKAQQAEKAQQENDKVLAQYPPAFQGRDEVVFLEKYECIKCRTYRGRVALIPCGHAKYCMTCINKLRMDAIKLKRPSKCLSENCYDLIEGWVQLYNVNV